MAEIDDWFRDHPLHQTIHALQAAVADALQRADSLEITEQLHRVARVADRAQALMEAADVDLLIREDLDTLTSQLQALRNVASEYAAKGAAAIIAQADPHAVAALRSMASMTLAFSPPSTEAWSDAAASYRRTVGQYIGRLKQETDAVRSQSDELRKELELLATAISDERANTGAAVTDLQGKFLDAETNRRTEFESDQTERRQAHEALMAEADAARVEAVTIYSERLSELRESAKGELTELRARLEEESNALISDLQDFRAQAANLAEATAVDAVGKEYRRQANDERDRADFWRSASVVFMGAAIVTAILLFVFFVPTTASGELEWSRVVRAVVLAALWGAPAAYAQAESTRHRKAERVSRRVALQLDALEPYLANFDGEKKVTLREEFGRALFAQPDDVEDVAGEKTMTSLFNLVELALKQARR